jgi:phage tail sheath gpL-like
MSQTVNFQSIPPGLQVPMFWAETSNAQAGVNVQQQRVLLIGGTLNAMPLVPVWAPPPAGTGSAGAGQAVAAQTGQGSMLAEMAALYRLNDPFTELWFLPIPAPSGGVAATATVVISGTPTAAGTLSLYVGDHLFAVPVTASQSATSIAAAVAAAINGAPAPVSATSSTGTVTLTAKFTGIHYNQLALQLNYQGAPVGEATPAGLTVSITGFSGGTGDVVLSGVAAAIGTQAFDFIVCGFNDATSRAALTTLESDSGGRWNWTNQLFGGAFVADVDTATNLQTLGGTMNDQHQCVIGCTGSPTAPWKIAAAVMGTAVPRIIAQPNIPLDGLVVQGVLAPPIGTNDGYSASTLQTLLTTGISPLTFDRAGACHIVRLISTYQTNQFGVSDQSYYDIGVLYTIMAVLRTLQANSTSRLAQKLLVDDGTPIGAGQPAISPSIERMNIYHDYLQMQANLWVEDAADFLAGLVVTRNATNPTRLDVLFDPHIVSGLHIYAVLNQFYLRAATPATITSA